MSSSHTFVQYALSIGALELIPGGRTLRSGRLSPYFFNSGLFTSGQSHFALANAYADTIMNMFKQKGVFDVVFGPAYKGIALAVSISEKLVVRNKLCDGAESIGWCYNRKEAKDHGEGGLLVGAPLMGKRVLVVDDVITDGASKREAVHLIRAHGGIPVGCVIAFDRMERGEDEKDHRSARERFSDEMQVPVVALATLDDLIQVLSDTRNDNRPALWGEVLPKVVAYQKQYGCSK